MAYIEEKGQYEAKESNVSAVSKIQRPAFNLERALLLGQNIYNDYSVTVFNDEMLSTILGHKTHTSGAYGRNRGALGYYDIIEKINDGANKGLFKLTDLYIEYVTEIDDIKKNQLLIKFFDSPTIFKTIKEFFPDLNSATKASISMQLVRNKKIDKDVAEEISDIFLESYNFCKNKMIHNHINNTNIEDVYVEEETDKQNSENIYKNEKRNSTELSHIYPFSNDRALTISLPSSMNELNEEELEDIQDYLNMLMSKLKRAQDKLKEKEALKETDN